MKLGAFASWAASLVGRGLAVAVPPRLGPQLRAWLSLLPLLPPFGPGPGSQLPPAPAFPCPVSSPTGPLGGALPDGASAQSPPPAQFLASSFLSCRELACLLLTPT